MNLSSLLKLKYPNIVFQTDVTLQDDGRGVYIKEWNLEDPFPTQEELSKWAIEFDLQYRQNKAVEARVYPSIGDQLDMLYKDMKSNTKTWVAAIDAIKAAHPKPTE
jgi:hypothetical protein